MITVKADRRERLDKLLARLVPEISRTRLTKWIELGKVRVNGNPAQPKTIVDPGANIQVEEIEATPAHDLTPADIPLEVVYEDEYLMAVCKPRGLATHPSPSTYEPTLVNALLGRGTALSEGLAPFRPGIVHRLDKETTGVIVVAKTDEAHAALARQIERKDALRLYVAIVRGEFAHDKFVISAPLARDPRDRLRMAVIASGRRAVTHVQVLRRVDAGTLIMCRLETGRTHQIRVHLRAVGCPIVGDPLYAPLEMQTAPMQLHAAALQVEHPVSGEVLTFVAPPPADFLAELGTEEILALVTAIRDRTEAPLVQLD
ncbi:MAG: RluA family pseudouridine synthase [Methanoregulaceae archaeon]|nr:RluA family pseudouridine synthase [Methanoregulaceae archaeon]